MRKRILSLLLTAALLLTMVPVMAAEEVQPQLYARPASQGSSGLYEDPSVPLEPFTLEAGAAKAYYLYYGVEGDLQVAGFATAAVPGAAQFCPYNDADSRRYLMAYAPEVGTLELNVLLADGTPCTCQVEVVLPEAGIYRENSRTAENLCPMGKVAYSYENGTTFWLLQEGGFSGTEEVTLSVEDCGLDLSWEFVDGALRLDVAAGGYADGSVTVQVGETKKTAYLRDDTPGLFLKNAYRFNNKLYEQVSLPEPLEALEVGRYYGSVLYYGVWGEEELVTRVATSDSQALYVSTGINGDGTLGCTLLAKQEGTETLLIRAGDQPYEVALDMILPYFGAYRQPERTAENLYFNRSVDFYAGEGCSFWLLVHGGMTGEEEVHIYDGPADLTWEFSECAEGMGLLVTVPETVSQEYALWVEILGEGWGVGQQLVLRPMERQLLGVIAGDTAYDGDTPPAFCGMIQVSHVWQLYYGSKRVTAVKPYGEAVTAEALTDASGDPCFRLRCDESGTYPVEIQVEGETEPLVASMYFGLPIYAFYRYPQRSEEFLLPNAGDVAYGGESVTFWMMSSKGMTGNEVVTFGDASLGLTYDFTEDTEGKLQLRITVPAGIELTSKVKVGVYVENGTRQAFYLVPSQEHLLAAATLATEWGVPLQELPTLKGGEMLTWYLYYGLPGAEKPVTAVDAGTSGLTANPNTDADGNLRVTFHAGYADYGQAEFQVQVQGDDTWYPCSIGVDMSGVDFFSENRRAADTCLEQHGLFTAGEGGEFWVISERGFYGDETVTFSEDLGLTLEFVDGAYKVTAPGTLQDEDQTRISFRRSTGSSSLWLIMLENSVTLRRRNVIRSVDVSLMREYQKGVYERLNNLTYLYPQVYALYYGTAVDAEPVTVVEMLSDGLTVERFEGVEAQNWFGIDNEWPGTYAARVTTESGKVYETEFFVDLPDVAFFDQPERTMEHLLPNQWIIPFVPGEDSYAYVLHKKGFTEQISLRDSVLPEGVECTKLQLADGTYALQFHVTPQVTQACYSRVSIFDDGLGMMQGNMLSFEPQAPEGGAIVTDASITDQVLTMSMDVDEQADPETLWAMIALYSGGRLVHSQSLPVQAGQTQVALDYTGAYDSAKIFMLEKDGWRPAALSVKPAM